MKVKKTLYIIFGLIATALAAIGAVLPLLPSFPFLCVAAFCFARSSEKLNTWLKSTKMYKNNFESFSKGEGMTWKTKIKILCTVTVLMAIGFIMMKNVPVGRIVLAIVWLLHIIVFVFFIKTKKSDALHTKEEEENGSSNKEKK